MRKVLTPDEYNELCTKLDDSIKEAFKYIYNAKGESDSLCTKIDPYLEDLTTINSNIDSLDCDCKEIEGKIKKYSSMNKKDKKRLQRINKYKEKNFTILIQLQQIEYNNTNKEINISDFEPLILSGNKKNKSDKIEVLSDQLYLSLWNELNDLIIEYRNQIDSINGDIEQKIIFIEELKFLLRDCKIKLEGLLVDKNNINNMITGLINSKSRYDEAQIIGNNVLSANNILKTKLYGKFSERKKVNPKSFTPKQLKKKI